MSTVTISGPLIAHVRACVDLSLGYVRRGRGVVNGTNAYTPYAFPSYVCAVASVEAFVNEQLTGPVASVVLRDSPLWNLGGDSLEKMELLTKIIIIPQFLSGRSFRRGGQPFQDFARLVRIRNDIVHFKMGMQAPRYLRHLEERGIAITNPSAAEGVDYAWPDRLSSTEGIRWAHNTARRVVNGLVEFVPSEHRGLLAGMVENYREIPDSEMRNRVMDACRGRSPSPTT